MFNTLIIRTRRRSALYTLSNELAHNTQAGLGRMISRGCQPCPTADLRSIYGDISGILGRFMLYTALCNVSISTLITFALLGESGDWDYDFLAYT
jgi:hypothetical protein